MGTTERECLRECVEPETYLHIEHTGLGRLFNVIALGNLTIAVQLDLLSVSRFLADGDSVVCRRSKGHERPPTFSCSSFDGAALRFWTSVHAFSKAAEGMVDVVWKNTMRLDFYWMRRFESKVRRNISMEW